MSETRHREGFLRLACKRALPVVLGFFVAFQQAGTAQASQDEDGDGFEAAEELKYGLVSSIPDEIAEGGVSIRRSTKLFMNFSGAKKVTVSSDPPGLVGSSENYHELNSTFTSADLSGENNGYVFSHWEVNGVRRADAGGVGLNRISETISGNKDVVAKYYPKNLDSDEDDIPDWYEWREFGNLDKAGADDPDGDGFTLADEGRLGLSPNVPDEIDEGGVSIRRSAKLAINFSGAKRLTVSSDPPGLVSSSDSMKDLNSTFTSADLSGENNGYVFSHWEVNGVRRADAGGVGLNEITETMSESKDLVAKYYPKNLDSDKDGTPDWYEWREFGNLDKNGGNDSDGDGFTLAEEAKYGLSPKVPDEIDEGGVSIRRTRRVFVNFSGAKRLRISSDPTGLVGSSDSMQDLNATFTSADLSGENNGYVFSHWEVNGVRRADAGGVGLNRITETMSEDKQVVAKYYPKDEDSDKDGTPDWYEWREFGNLDKNGADDPDGDGFTLAEEEKFGLSPTVPDEMEEGGVSIRRALQLNFTQASIDANSTQDSDGDGLTDAQELALGLDPNKTDTDGDGFADGVEVTEGSNANDRSSLANYAPTNLELNGTSVDENQPAGTVVGTFTVTDPDANSTHLFAFAEGNGSTHNHLFTIDTNGTLKTTATFDHEANATLSIRVKVTDEHNATLQQAFVISVNNVVEDLDGDGIEDHADPDDDGDGFSDAEEIAYGSDHRDAQSVANQAPTLLDLNGTSVAENSNVGSVVGILNATDSDANATITLAFTDGNGSQHNNLFTLDANGTLRTTETFDYETNATALHVRVKATDEHNASLAKAFVINVTNVVEDLDGDGIEDHFDPDDDGDGFSDAVEIAYGSDPRDATSVANAPPADLNATAPLAIAENQPAGTIVGELNATDSDANATITLAFADGNGSQHNHLFTIDANGTLKTTATFDYETNATALHIRVKATDEHNASIEKVFAISVTDVFENSAPAFSESNASFTNNENLASSFSVTATDPDANATLLYSKSGPDAGLFTLNVATGELAFVDPPDFENPTDANQNGVYDLTITVSDGTASASKSVSIEIGDVLENVAPVDIGLSHATIAENQPVETIVGDFNATDPDANATHVFTLVDGNGSAHNASFAIDANGTLRTATVLDFEANGTSLAIRIKATDEHNASLEKTFTITITDDPSDNPVIPDTNATSPDTNATSPDANATSPDANATSPDANATSPDANATSPDANATSPDANATSVSDENGSVIPSPVYTPIVRTLPATMDADGKLRLGGKVMSDGDSTPTEVGFILSRTLAIDPADPNLVRLEATLSEGNFTLLAQPPESLGKEIYYRAYARNSAGESYATVKRISLSGNLAPVASWLAGSEEATAGWRNSSWFGSFYKTSTPWLYHEELGWLYALDDGAGNAWLWHESHGWLWTGKDLFRHLYRNRDGIWLYFLKRKDGYPYFYNHTTKQVE